MPVPHDIDAILVKQLAQWSDSQITPSALALPKIAVIILVGGVGGMVVANKGPQCFRFPRISLLF